MRTRRALEGGAGPLLQAENVCLHYGNTPALRDLSLGMAAGEFVAMTGPPGCGKSTAALALLGLTRSPGRISGGRVLLRGRDLLALDHTAASELRGREIALVTQGPRGALHPLLTVGEQLGTVLQAGRRLSRRAAHRAARDWLARVGIQDPDARMKAYVHELSTGMAQRVVFAMALCREPALLVADEPTSGLDVTIQAQVLDDLADTVTRLGTAVLLVTQELALLERYCQRVLVMDAGAVVESQATDDFFASPRHAYSRAIVSLAASRPGTDSAAPTGAPLLEVRAAHKAFAGRGGPPVVAVDGVDLSLRRAETLGLVGESGSGKTTLARCLLQLEALDSGSVLLRGQPLAGAHRAVPAEQRAAMQVVFQDPLDSMNPRWPVAPIIEEPLRRLTTLTRRARRDRVRALLHRVGLGDAVAAVRPGTLSAGEQQRVAVARAMATAPAFVVLDEPTSALDPQARADFLALLSRLQDETGVSYLFISHDLASIRHACHRVAVLYLGQVVEEGTAAQIFEAPAHPYTRALIDAEAAAGATGHARVRLSGDIRRAAGAGCYLSPRCPFATARCENETQTLETLPDGRRLRCRRAVAGELA